MILSEKFEECEAMLAHIDPESIKGNKDLSDKVAQLHTKLDLQKSAEGAGEIEELKAKVELHAAGASQSAIAAVEKAGGKIVLPAPASE